jgi:hypothetical protein
MTFVLGFCGHGVITVGAYVKGSRSLHAIKEEKKDIMGCALNIPGMDHFQ